MALMGTWTSILATLLTNVIPSTFRQNVITRLNDVYNTVIVEHDVDNGYHKFQTWTTAGRPGSPTTRMIGLNSNTEAWEYYDGTNWRAKAWRLAIYGSLSNGATADEEFEISYANAGASTIVLTGGVAAALPYKGRGRVKVDFLWDNTSGAASTLCTLKSSTTAGSGYVAIAST